MGALGEPSRVITSKELQRLARGMERDAALRRKLLKRVDELEGSIRAARRLFQQLVDTLGLVDDRRSDDAAPEVAP